MILQGDCLEVLATLEDGSIQTCVTSPPYFGLRDYGIEGQVGLEESPQEYVAKILKVFREIKRVLKKDGTAWLNLGDSYAGYHGNKNAETPTSATNGWTNGTNENKRRSTANRHGLKQKDLIGIPWRVAFALQGDGWYLRSDIIWSKPNGTPESVRDRPTYSHEYIFLLSKAPKYYYDADLIKEDAANAKQGKKNKRSVWTVPTKPYKGAHFATFPPELIRPCVLAGAPKGGTVLDPFCGSGTVGAVCKEEGREFIGIELNPSYIELAEERIGKARAKLF